MLTIVTICATAVLAASMLLNGFSMSTAMALLLCTMAASALVLGDLGRIIRPLINKKRLEVLDRGCRADSKKLISLSALIWAIRESHPILLLVPIYTYAAYAIGAFDISIFSYSWLAVVGFFINIAEDAVEDAKRQWKLRMYQL